MSSLDYNTKVFLELVRAGLWDQNVKLLEYGNVAFNSVYQIATGQSVVGLIAAGIERITDAKAPKELVLTIVGETLQLEQKNKAMNAFIGMLTRRLQEKSIDFVLVKGQGVAQCYERPLWRAFGDVDLLLDEKNYFKAKDCLCSYATAVDREERDRMHLAMTIDGWTVELHGTLRGNMLERIDKGIDRVQEDVFSDEKFRIWKNENTEVLLPAPTEDSLFIFTHILHHFTQGGIGLRQVCDWCRLLWKYRDEIDKGYLEKRLKEMKLMSEWKVFGAMTVEYLGMPLEALPFYSDEKQWKRKAERLMSFILKTGNMGANRDLSYYERHSYVVSKLISLKWHTTDAIEQFAIFPMDSMKIWGWMLVNGVKRIMNHRLGYEDNR